MTVTPEASTSDYRQYPLFGDQESVKADLSLDYQFPQAQPSNPLPSGWVYVEYAGGFHAIFNMALPDIRDAVLGFRKGENTLAVPTPLVSIVTGTHNPEEPIWAMTMVDRRYIKRVQYVEDPAKFIEEENAKHDTTDAANTSTTTT